jgi:hypothetical protein
MSTNSLNGEVGQVAHFGGDYLFRDQPLPNNTTMNSEEHTLNNTLGRLQLTGRTDKSLSLTGTNELTITLQYKDGTAWNDDTTLVSLATGDTLPAGKIFEIIPPPSSTKRFYRVQIKSNFNASTVKLTAAVEVLPLA